MRKKHGKTAHPGTLAGTPNGSLTLDLVTVLFQLQHAETISLKYSEIIPNSYSQTFPDRLEAWKPLRFAGPRSNIWASSKGVTAPSSSKPGRNEACENQQTNSNMEKKHETTTILQHEIEMESVIVTDNWLPYARTSARSLNTLKQLDLPCRTLLKEETWLNHVTRFALLHPFFTLACAHVHMHVNDMCVVLQPPSLRITSSSALMPKLPSSLRFADASSAWTADWSSQHFGGLTFQYFSHILRCIKCPLFLHRTRDLNRSICIKFVAKAKFAKTLLN